MPGFAPGMAPPPMMMGYPGGMMASAGSIAPQEAEDYVSAAVQVRALCADFGRLESWRRSEVVDASLRMCHPLQHLGTDDNPAAMDIPKALDAMWEQETQRIRDLDMPTEQGASRRRTASQNRLCSGPFACCPCGVVLAGVFMLLALLQPISRRCRTCLSPASSAS